MSDPAPDEADPGDRPPNDAPSPADEPLVVFEFTVPAEAFVLGDALRAFPEVIVEFERLVPTNHEPLPFFWTNDGDDPEFESALADDPKVAELGKGATFDEGALYHAEWNIDDGGLLQWIADTGNDIALLQAEGQGEEWTLKLRFPSRTLLSEFRAYYDERGVDLHVVRLYDLTDPKLGQYNLTSKQREALVSALEMGHFEIPRQATLEEIAESLDISPKALSERLRRGQTNLVSNTLTIGRPSGVGLGEQ